MRSACRSRKDNARAAGVFHGRTDGLTTRLGRCGRACRRCWQVPPPLLLRNATPSAFVSGMTTAEPRLTLYGAQASGSIAVEAALTLLGIPYTLVEGATWADNEARERVAPVNPMRQIPTLVMPGGEIMTESAAILIYLADLHASAGLAPAPTDARRRQYLRWMVYVSSAIYSLHWIKPDVGRIGAPESARASVVDAVHERIAFCWSNMDGKLTHASTFLATNCQCSTCTSPSCPASVHGGIASTRLHRA